MAGLPEICVCARVCGRVGRGGSYPFGLRQRLARQAQQRDVPAAAAGAAFAFPLCLGTLGQDGLADRSGQGEGPWTGYCRAHREARGRASSSLTRAFSDTTTLQLPVVSRVRGRAGALIELIYW